MHRVRKAESKEMDTIYMMGYDVWSNHSAPNEYLEICRHSVKYKQGEWYVLTELGTNRLLSSLIVYKLDLHDQTVIRGIGSIATVGYCRKAGNATELVKTVISILTKQDACDDFFLYSDIGAQFYNKLGFNALPRSRQKYKESICMYYSQTKDTPSSDCKIPDYF
ncbi:N-acetyltransferase [Sporolactobacillus pectinivorans]|uniref:N-acetyltransferase n=1 Tax=Sporolactobacillus pectinivorans TaxID=1591408 RepID=UPI000C268820|nr:N-acetyltransferase [Sporolactobacillus pectinivorans]